MSAAFLFRGIVDDAAPAMRGGTRCFAAEMAKDVREARLARYAKALAAA